MRVSIDMVSYPRSRSVDATVTAVASPCAISIAKEGPERYASGRSGPSTSTITSDIICSVPVSMPLVMQITGTSGGIAPFTLLSTSRENWHG